jgi:hypothetical protein
MSIARTEMLTYSEGSEMKQILRVSLLVACALVYFAKPVLAHHAFEAEFSDQKPISITGVITRVDWVNPHAYVFLDAKDESGRVANWSFETLPPGMLHRSGMSKEMLPVGQTITIDGYAAKDGTKTLGWIKRLHFSDGRMIEVTKDNPGETANK